jgi:hypothetical protein
MFKATPAGILTQDFWVVNVNIKSTHPQSQGRGNFL